MKVCNFTAHFTCAHFMKSQLSPYRCAAILTWNVALSVFTCCLSVQGVCVCVFVNRLVSCRLVFDTTTRLLNGVHYEGTTAFRKK